MQRLGHFSMREWLYKLVALASIQAKSQQTFG
jgi:hypothetical protein